MKKFLTMSIICFLFAIVFSVGIFVYVQYELGKPVITELAPQTVPASQSEREPILPADIDVKEKVSASPEQEGIPLNTLPLNDTQQKVLEVVNINPDTFVITPEMIECAKEVLGAERYNAIIKGEAPGFLEAASLLKCSP